MTSARDATKWDTEIVPLLARTLFEDGVPTESATKCAAVAVETIRTWLWLASPCICVPDYRERGLEDPDCPSHDYDRLLGGNGIGVRLNPSEERARLAVLAAKLQQQYGEEIYKEMFAPTFAKVLRELGDGVTTN